MKKKRKKKDLDGNQIDKKLTKSMKKTNTKLKEKESNKNLFSYKVNNNPFLSFSLFNQPIPIKKNFDKFFNNNKTNKHEGSPKRQIAIFKTKAIENHMRKKEELKQSMSELKNMNNILDPFEIDRNDVDLTASIKVVNNKKKSTNKNIKTNTEQHFMSKKKIIPIKNK